MISVLIRNKLSIDISSSQQFGQKGMSNVGRHEADAPTKRQLLLSCQLPQIRLRWDRAVDATFNECHLLKCEETRNISCFMHSNSHAATACRSHTHMSIHEYFGRDILPKTMLVKTCRMYSQIHTHTLSIEWPQRRHWWGHQDSFYFSLLLATHPLLPIFTWNINIYKYIHKWGLGR